MAMNVTQRRKATIHVQVTRADGTVEDHGVVAYHHDDPAWVTWFNDLKAQGQHVSEADALAKE